MSPLDLIAHPVALWALGLLGSLSRTMVRAKDRIMPWTWIARNPGRAATAVLGSIMLLAILERAGQLDGPGMLPALLALGSGALGSEALPLVVDKSRAVARKVLKEEP